MEEKDNKNSNSIKERKPRFLTLLPSIARVKLTTLPNAAIFDFTTGSVLTNLHRLDVGPCGIHFISRSSIVKDSGACLVSLFFFFFFNPSKIVLLKKEL